VDAEEDAIFTSNREIGRAVLPLVLPVRKMSEGSYSEKESGRFRALWLTI